MGGLRNLDLDELLHVSVHHLRNLQRDVALPRENTEAALNKPGLESFPRLGFVCFEAEFRDETTTRRRLTS